MWQKIDVIVFQARDLIGFQPATRRALELFETLATACGNMVDGIVYTNEEAAEGIFTFIDEHELTTMTMG
jgi:hypothetical protein